MCVFFLHLRRLSGSFCGASVSREKLRRLTGWWRRSQLATATVTPGSSNPPVRTQRGFVSPESLSLAVQLKSVINFQRLEKKGNTRRVISLIRIKFFFLSGDFLSLRVDASFEEDWMCVSVVFVLTDTCYILSFAIIMLNTSLHNPNVKDKPSLQRFVSMNRGINNGEDLSIELLTVWTSRVSLIS